MENYLQPIDNTLLTVEKLFPPEKESTKFDKVIDLIKGCYVYCAPFFWRPPTPHVLAALRPP